MISLTSWLQPEVYGVSRTHFQRSALGGELACLPKLSAQAGLVVAFAYLLFFISKLGSSWRNESEIFEGLKPPNLISHSWNPQAKDLWLENFILEDIF